MTQKNEQGIAHVLPIVAVVLVLAIAGVGYRVYQNGKSDAKASVSTKSDDSSSADVITGDLSTLKPVAEITADAADKLNGASVTGVELESEDGALVYKLYLSDGRALKFNAATGAAIGTATAEEENKTDAPVVSTADLIGFQKAREVAATEHPNVSVSKIELEMEDGVLVYSVRFTDKARVDVNAKTAAIVRTKPAETKTQSSGSNSGSGSTGSSSGSNSGSGSGSSSSGSGGSSSSDDDSSSDDNSSSSSSGAGTSTATGITEAQAKTIANNRLPGKTIEKVELETEDGAVVYSVRYTDDSRVDVRKSDGVIVRVR